MLIHIDFQPLGNHLAAVVFGLGPDSLLKKYIQAQITAQCMKHFI